MKNFFDTYCKDEGVLRALSETEITEPTPVQALTLPAAAESADDLVVQAPTGTGKTLAFLLPILRELRREESDVQALILCPTRELVTQIVDVLAQLTKYTERVRYVGLYGGQNIQKQLLLLRKKPQIVAGTPGRLLDHLQRHTLKLAKLRWLVLDEGDEMLDMGFRPDMEKIMAQLPSDCRKALFSATLPETIKEIVRQRFLSPCFLRAAASESEEAPKIAQKYCLVKDSQRLGVFLSLMETHGYRRVIAFCNTKLRAERLAEGLVKRGADAVAIHSDLRQTRRSAIMRDFKEGRLRVLVATDVAARGIDVDDVDAIFNIDPPTDVDFYVHRIGRTARARKDGVAYTLVTDKQLGALEAFRQRTGIEPVFEETPAAEAAYTLPRDASNRLRKEEAAGACFFLNVGSRDKLDADAIIRWIVGAAGIARPRILDVKVRDTYSFVEVVADCAPRLLGMRGMQTGNRTLNIEPATTREKPAGDAPRKRYGKPTAEKGEKRGGRDDRPRERRAYADKKNEPRARRQTGARDKAKEKK